MLWRVCYKRQDERDTEANVWKSANDIYIAWALILKLINQFGTRI